ncbi:MAG: response regulator transcription factor [Methylococcales bacterium]|nr:response regulator transcription factor [Methylococcales bacterium]
MLNLLVIDNTAQIRPALSDVEVNLSLHDDEVQALIAVEKIQPSVILLNYEVRKEETADYIKLILKASIESKIIVIADQLSEEKIVNYIIAGAKGYQDVKQLQAYAKKIIKVVDAGEAWITRRMVAILLDELIKK